MNKIPKNIDYDYDEYYNKIRRFKREGGEWVQDTTFEPERSTKINESNKSELLINN